MEFIVPGEYGFQRKQLTRLSSYHAVPKPVPCLLVFRAKALQNPKQKLSEQLNLFSRQAWGISSDNGNLAQENNTNAAQPTIIPISKVPNAIKISINVKAIIYQPP